MRIFNAGIYITQGIGRAQRAIFSNKSTLLVSSPLPVLAKRLLVLFVTTLSSACNPRFSAGTAARMQPDGRVVTQCTRYTNNDNRPGMSEGTFSLPDVPGGRRGDQTAPPASEASGSVGTLWLPLGARRSCSKSR